MPEGASSDPRETRGGGVATRGQTGTNGEPTGIAWPHQVTGPQALAGLEQFLTRLRARVERSPDLRDLMPEVDQAREMVPLIRESCAGGYVDQWTGGGAAFGTTPTDEGGGGGHIYRPGDRQR